MTANNSLKTPYTLSLNRFAQQKVLSAIQMTGRGLPCTLVSKNGPIVTVKFEIDDAFTLPQITIPLFGPQYVRYPLQPGDSGVTIAADARLGGVSGLGGGVADLSQPGNLTALVFLPIGHTEWQAVDPNAVTVYGPNGVVLRDEGSSTTFVLTPNSIAVNTPESFKVICGATTFETTPAGWTLSGTSGNLQDGAAHTSPEIMNEAWAALVTWLNTHDHTSSGSGNPTSPPITPFSGGNIAPGI